jgi:threonine/homoserine/homoserine lactone efflux protein
MLTAFVVGVVVSFGMAILPGPIAIAVIKQALEGRYRDGVEIAVSASGMDVLYALIASFASSAIVASLMAAVLSREWLMLLFQIVCVVVLFVLGLRYYRATAKDAVETERKEELLEERARRMHLKSPFVVGAMIAITNLASPSFLPTLLLIISYLHRNEWIEASPWANVAYSIGFGLGAFLWFLLLLRFLHSRRERIPPNFVRRIYKFAGITFFVFAVIIAYHIVVETKWSAVL